MRRVLAFLLVAFAPAAGQAQNITLDRVDIVEAGIYQIHRTGEVVQSPNTAVGTIRSADRRELIEATTTVPAKVGTSFGIRFVAIGEPMGTKMNVTFITRYPAQGLRNPNTGKIAYKSEFEWGIETGKRVARTYSFDNAWEAVPGEWALEFWHQGRKLGGQTFTVVAR